MGDLLVLFLCLFCFFHRWYLFSSSGNYMQNQTISSKFKVAITVAIKQWMEFWDATNSYDVITSSQNNKHISNGRIEWHQFHRITTTDFEWIEVGKKKTPTETKNLDHPLLFRTLFRNLCGNTVVRLGKRKKEKDEIKHNKHSTMFDWMEICECIDKCSSTNVPEIQKYTDTQRCELTHKNEQHPKNNHEKATTNLIAPLAVNGITAVAVVVWC